MWTLSYTISQILTFIIYILLVLTYIERSRKQILITNIASHILQGAAFYLLGGMTGLAMNVFYMIRDIFFLKDSKNEKSEKLSKRDFIILGILMMIVIFFAIISYDGIYSLFSVFATITSTIAIWQRNTKIYRFLGIICCIFWLGYHISLNSIVAIILECCLLIATIIGVIREVQRNKRKLATSDYY